MSAEKYTGHKLNRLLKPAGKIALAGLASGYVGIIGITWRDHRELTHRSLELHPFLQKFFDLEKRSIAVGDTSIWASVHRIHHQMPDVSLYPYYRIARAIQWTEENRDKVNLSIPDSFGYLDPFVDTFTRDEVMEIGGLADELTRERLGDEYKQPSFDSLDELAETLYPNGPTYYYPNYEKKHEYTDEDIARILLTDPHSPALIAPRNNHLNGVKGVARSNIFLYRNDADMFRARPDLKPDDLKTGNEGNEKKRYPAITGGFVLAGLGVLAYRKKFRPEDFLIAALVGGTINGIRIGTELVGGNLTNSLGHAGVLTRNRMIRAAMNREYHIVLNDDGTLSTDTIHVGALGKLISWLTLDEVGGQQRHHENPEKIAYTTKEGLQAWLEAPFGSFTSFLAHSKLPFINPGKGFDLKEDEIRPDKPHPAVLLIQAKRAKEKHEREQF